MLAKSEGNQMDGVKNNAGKEKLMKDIPEPQRKDFWVFGLGIRYYTTVSVKAL